MANLNLKLAFVATYIFFLSCSSSDSELLDDSIVEIPSLNIVFENDEELDFQNLVVGHKKSISFEIQNIGNVALSVSAIAVPSGFSIDWISGDIPVGEIQKVQISFEPTEEKNYEGLLIIESNVEDGPLNIDIKGNGVNEIYTGDLVFSTQDKLEEFIANGYTKIDGSLHLELGVNSLKPLEKITSVHRLDVFSSSIESLVGIENLEISEFLQFAKNSSLKTLEGFPSTSEATYGISFNYNPLITDLAPLSNLKSCNSLYIANGDNLLSLDGVSNLTEVKLDLGIVDLPKIKNLDGLSNLTSVGTSLSISGNENLTSYCGIKEFLIEEGLGGTFYQPSGNRYNPTRWDIQDVACEMDVPDNVIHGKLRFIYQSGLDSYDFSGYDTIDGDLVIGYNADYDVISSLSKLSVIKNVTGDININSTLLTNLDQLSGLETANAFYIENNSKLLDYCGISALVEDLDIHVSISENLYNPTKEELIAAETCSQD